MANAASSGMPHSVSSVSSSQETTQMLDAMRYVNPEVKENAPLVPGVSNGQSVRSVMYDDGLPPRILPSYGPKTAIQFAHGVPSSGIHTFTGQQTGGGLINPPPPTAVGPQSFSLPEGARRALHPTIKSGNPMASLSNSERSSFGALSPNQVYSGGSSVTQTVINSPSPLHGNTSQHPLTNGTLAHKTTGTQSSQVPRGLPMVRPGPLPVTHSPQQPSFAAPSVGSTAVLSIKRLPNPPAAGLVNHASGPPKATTNQLPTSVPSGLQQKNTDCTTSHPAVRPLNIQVSSGTTAFQSATPPPPVPSIISSAVTTTSALQVPDYDPSNSWHAPNLPSGSASGKQQWPHQPQQLPGATTGVCGFPSQTIHPGISTSSPLADQFQWRRQPTAPQPRLPAPSLSRPNFANNYGVDYLGNQMNHLSLQRSEPIDLLQTRNILPPSPIKPPKIELPQFDSKTSNCNPDVFRCTLARIPESQSLLQKSRLPLGILIHPFKDLINLPVVQCNVIVRCRSCRTYINPFVQFVDQHHWKCNLCYRVNELQEEFQYDPISKTYGDPTRRPEIKSATIEFIAPSEYMLRPPQPAVYLFILDVSYSAVESGYLRCFCDTLLEELEKLPGDARTRVGFMTFDHALHFYNLADGFSQPQLMVVSDIEDVFLPCPDNLLVNLNERKELVRDLLLQLPALFIENKATDSALGAALQAGFKLVSPTGGRITVVQGCLPNVGPGALKAREDPNLRAGKEVPNLGPANDFYKKLSLNCSGQQVAVDLFLISSQYCDIATLSCISKYSGGCINYYPGFHAQLNPGLAEKFEQDLKRYLTRKIGFEAVMRIRCTKGLSIHTFHGNFFVRSTDLLSLPNINPDAGFAMQMSIEEPLSDCNTACFQAALLYTSSKGERRIRVHTLCLPVTASVAEVINNADQQAIVGLLTKMAVDKSLSSSMSDARDALINACVDAILAYRLIQGNAHHTLLVPPSLRILPLYILSMLKHLAFRLGTSTKLDERVFAMNQMKTLPLTYLMTYIYPNMYAVHNLVDVMNCTVQNDNPVPQPALLQLSSEKFERQGVFLLDAGDHMFLYVCQGVKQQYCQNVLNSPNFDGIPEKMTELPEMDNNESEQLRQFINYLQSQRPFHATFQVLKNTSKHKQEFLQYLIEDRTESTFSYCEFLKHIGQLICK